MDSRLLVVIIVVVVCIAAGVITWLMLDALGPTPGGPEWDALYEKNWFRENSFCEVCGRPLGWNSLGGTYFDAMTGAEYIKEIWGCPEYGHTHFNLVDWCQRRDYLDAPASEA